MNSAFSFERCNVHAKNGGGHKACGSRIRNPHAIKLYGSSDSWKSMVRSQHAVGFSVRAGSLIEPCIDGGRNKLHPAQTVGLTLFGALTEDLWVSG